MPAYKDSSVKSSYALTRSFSGGGMTMSARVYHPATNLMPPSPPISPTSSMPPNFLSQSKSTSSMSYGRQNSQNGGKYS